MKLSERMGSGAGILALYLPGGSTLQWDTRPGFFGWHYFYDAVLSHRMGIIFLVTQVCSSREALLENVLVLLT